MHYFLLIANVFITTVLSSREGDLKKILLDSYDKSSRPVQNVRYLTNFYILYNNRFYNSKLGIRYGGGVCGFDFAINS